MQVVPGRQLPGWDTSSSSSSSSAGADQSDPLEGAAARDVAAGDCLLLTYEVPWPLCLVLGGEDLQHYGEVFSVLLRLKRLQLKLQKCWQQLVVGKSRSGRGSYSRTGSNGRGTTSGKRSGASGWLSGGALRAGCVDMTLDERQHEVQRQQQLLLWMFTARHFVTSLQGHFQCQLESHLQQQFAEAVAVHPVPVPDMAAAHKRLVAAARHCCFLGLTEVHQAGPVGDNLVRVGSACSRLVCLCWELAAAVLAGSGVGAALGSSSGRRAAGHILGRAGWEVEVDEGVVRDEHAWGRVEELGRRMMVELDDLQEELQQEKIRSQQAADLLVRLGHCL